MRAGCGLADLLDRRRAFRGIASRHDDVGTGPCQCRGDVETDTSGSGDHGGSTDLRRNIGCCPACHDACLVDVGKGERVLRA